MSLHYFGKIVKPHGLDGFLSVMCEPHLLNFISLDLPVFLEIKGIPVPFFIDKFKILTDSNLLMSFSDYNTLEQAKRFVSCKVFIDLDTEVPLSYDDERQFVGYSIVDEKLGELGVIKDFIIKNQNLFVIDADDREILIPIVDKFFEKIDVESKTIFMNIPDGIIF